MAKEPRPVVGVTVEAGPMDFELLVGQLDQAERGDGDRQVAGRCPVGRGEEGGGHWPRTLFAFRSILAFSAGVMLPFLTCWLARALALAAWLLSGIGYLRSSGSPNVLPFRLPRFFSDNSAMRYLLQCPNSHDTP